MPETTGTCLFLRRARGRKLQAIDQVHLNNDSKIDHINYLYASHPGGPEVCRSHQSKIFSLRELKTMKRFGSESACVISQSLCRMTTI